MALIDKLTAVADAVRGKTGKTAELTLAEMATEINELVLGSQIATGTFTKTTDRYYQYSITISGIPFKPTAIIAYAKVNYFGSGVNMLYFIDTVNGYIRYENATNVRDGSSHYSIKMNDNGFSINILKEKDSNGAYNNIAGGTWNYIAIS